MAMSDMSNGCYIRGAQIPDATLPWDLILYQCRLIYLDPSYGTCFTSPRALRWILFLENFCTPAVYGFSSLHFKNSVCVCRNDGIIGMYLIDLESLVLISS